MKVRERLLETEDILTVTGTKGRKPVCTKNGQNEGGLENNCVNRGMCQRQQVLDAVAAIRKLASPVCRPHRSSVLPVGDLSEGLLGLVVLLGVVLGNGRESRVQDARERKTFVIRVRALGGF